MAFKYIQLFIVVVISCCCMKNMHSYKVSNNKIQKFGRVGGQKWSEIDDFQGFNVKILGTTGAPASTQVSQHDMQMNNNNKAFIPTSLQHLGDYNPHDAKHDADKKKNDNFNLNVGKALEVLRRELPFVFVLSNLDFSIFSSYVTVADGNNNKMVMPITLYSGAVKSLKIAASFSSIYPSMNVKKIEYIEDSAMIQVLVDVVLPDSVRVEGQAVWEGMFYFGLDNAGLISSHIFDRKISNKTPAPMIAAGQFPWLQKRAMWQTDLLTGVASKVPVFASSHNNGETSSSSSSLVQSSTQENN